jgi:hypothetical protein
MLVNAIRVPSGDHAGSPSKTLFSVSRRSLEPSGAIERISASPKR